MIKSTLHFYDSLYLKVNVRGWSNIPAKAYFHVIENVSAKIELPLLGLLFIKEMSTAWQVRRYYL